VKAVPANEITNDKILQSIDAYEMGEIKSAAYTLEELKAKIHG